jgi:predicted phage baseplate assembly protein
MNAPGARELNDCGCCEGLHEETPVEIRNAAGLSALVYRVGTHSRFKRSMLVGLTRQTVLLELTTRRDDDPTIGLLDAWATALDVLTFYQERIANEGFLRTSTERRSLLELARAIGYELRPGVAASTCLQFTMETAAGAPRQTTVSAGTKAQSVPGENEQAQIFETIEEIKARPAWNAMKPRMTQRQLVEILGPELRYRNSGPLVAHLYFTGTSTGLSNGDWILVTTGSGNQTQTWARRIAQVTIDNDLKRTQVDLETSGGELPPIPPATHFDPVNFPVNAPPLPFTAEQIESQVLARNLREGDLQTFLEVNRWNAEQLSDFVAKRNATLKPSGQAVFVFRERAGFFGNNAPAYTTLRDRYNNPLLYPDWDTSTGWSIWEPPANLSARPLLPPMKYITDPRLERAIPGIAKNSWAVFSSGTTWQVFRVTESHEASAVGFGISGKTTVLSLLKPDLSSATSPNPPAFLVRETAAHIKSEELELAPLPVSDVIAAGVAALELEEMVVGLKTAQLVVLRGERSDAPGVISQELLALQEIIHHDGHTTILFHEQSSGAGLRYSYLRKTVTLNANVARATHGETKREVLGSGKGAQAFQKFVLKQAPLTYVSAPTPAGVASTLQLRVNDVLWDESPTLYRRPPSARIFVTRRDDDGKTTAQFGDGITGARLPSGIENVSATYRVGLGLAGMVKAKQISVLLSRPLGLKEVENPLPASGGGDPENRDQARENAPVTVLTLDRIVSLQDFEDYVRSYPGIGKAQASSLWQGENKIVHLTIAGADGNPVSTISDLYKNLKGSIDSARAPGPPVEVGSFIPLSFNIQAKLSITRGYLGEKVRAAVSEALIAAFSFHSRSFGQAVTKGELYRVIQTVDGVEAVDLDYLYLSPSNATLENRLPVRTAGWNQANGLILAAELLLINPRGITLLEMAL